MKRRNFVTSVIALLAGLPFIGWKPKKEVGFEYYGYNYITPKHTRDAAEWCSEFDKRVRKKWSKHLETPENCEYTEEIKKALDDFPMFSATKAQTKELHKLLCKFNAKKVSVNGKEYYDLRPFYQRNAGGAAPTTFV